MNIYERPYKRSRRADAAAARATELARSLVPIERLPDEMLVLIFSRLRTEQRQSVCTLVSRHWRRCADGGRKSLGMRVAREQHHAVFDLTSIAVRFPRLRWLRLGEVNEFADDGDDDSSSMDALGLGFRSGRMPRLPPGFMHPRTWLAAFDSRHVYWAATVSVLQLTRVVLPPQTGWLNQLHGLHTVIMSEVAHVTLAQLVGSYLRGSAATLKRLYLNTLIRDTLDESVSSIRLLLAQFSHLEELRIQHMSLTPDRSATATEPFPEHAALTRLELQYVRGACFPLHLLRAPNLKTVLMHKVLLAAQCPVVPMPAVTTLKLGHDVVGFKELRDVSRWFPNLTVLKVPGGQSVNFDAPFNTFSTRPREEAPHLQQLIYYTTVHIPLFLILTQFSETRDGLTIGVRYVNNIYTDWLKHAPRVKDVIANTVA